MNRQRRNRIKNIIGLILIPLFMFGWFRWFEHAQTFQPTRHLFANGEALGRPWQEVWLTAEDGPRLHAWFFPADIHAPHRQYVILLCHGNAGNLGNRIDVIQLLLQTGANVFAFDYRGYGRSEGYPTEAGTYRDAEAAHAWLLQQDFNPKYIIAHGNSLGGAVACSLAVNKPVGGLILQSTFTSLPDLGSELFPWLPVRWLASMRYDSRQRLPKIHVPILFLHSREDGLIGFHHSEKNMAAANEPKWLHELHGGHNSWIEVDPHSFVQAIRQFLDHLENNRPPGQNPPYSSPTPPFDSDE